MLLNNHSFIFLQNEEMAKHPVGGPFYPQMKREAQGERHRDAQGEREGKRHTDAQGEREGERHREAQGERDRKSVV